MTIAKESEEQRALFEWAVWNMGKWPELAMLFHIPNGGKRGKAEAARLKAEGVSAGVPDLCLPAPRGGYHGLYIELKRIKGGEVSKNQKEWLALLNRQGYFAAVCFGWQEAARAITKYLEGGKPDGRS